MSTDTQYLSLTLVNGGDNVGTWGPILNKNFLTIDDLAGEVIEARGDSSNISDRFNEITSELSVARGTTPTLNDRISHLLNPDGTARAQNLPRAGVSTFGAVYISSAPSQSDVPVALGVNDPRVLTNVEKSELTDGSVTSLHMHNMSSISDVTATASEISVALSGISQNVTSANLNTLTSGGVVPKSLMTIPNAAKDYTGIVSLSVEPISGNPIALAENDNRVLTDVQKNELVSKANTSLHKHKLADGASDLIVTATELNRFAGSPSTVTSSNLGALTSGGSTELHNHNNTYYLKSEVDTKDLDVQNKATTYVSNHNNSNDSHSGADLSLGRIVAKAIRLDTKDSSVDIKAVTDDTSAIKILVRDSSGLPVITMSSDGTISTKKIISEEQQITKNTVSEHNSIVANNLTINGNTILGDSEAEDTLIVNSKPVFNSAVEFKQSIIVDGDIQYAGLDVIRDDIASINTELTHAKSTYPSIDDRITDQVKIVQDSIDLFATRKDNPNEVTLTQSILADGTTDITSIEMETLTNGSNADGLHTHEKYDAFMEQSNVSAIYGQFDNISERIDNSEQLINSINTEVTNARQSYASIDGRLDDMSTLLLSHDDSIIKDSEALRFAELRIKALEVNSGNIGNEDIDWGELKGDKGDTGPAGPDGANGLSAYEVALSEGFIGTTSEWLESLIGPKGDKGDPGDSTGSGTEGPMGPEGPKGDTGDAGPNGKSAYQVAVDNGFVGSESEWLESLKATQPVVNKLWYSATSPDIDISNGEKQKFTASSDSTISILMSDGDDMTILINPSTFSITWPAITWFGGSPALTPNILTTVVLSKDDTDIYGWWQEAS